MHGGVMAMLIFIGGAFVVSQIINWLGNTERPPWKR